MTGNLVKVLVLGGLMAVTASGVNAYTKYQPKTINTVRNQEEVHNEYKEGQTLSDKSQAKQKNQHRMQYRYEHRNQFNKQDNMNA